VTPAARDGIGRLQQHQTLAGMLALPARCRVCVFVAAALCAPALAQTDTQNAPTPASPSESVTKRLDPTDFKTRVETRLEYQSLENGGSRTFLVPRFEYAFSKKFSARIDVPYFWNNADPSLPGDQGLSDITVRLNWRAARGEGYAVVVGPEFLLNTAEDPRLGLGKTVFQPVVFASIDVPQYKSVLFPFVQQFWSIAGDPDRNDINVTLLRLGLATRWPDRYYSFVEPSLYIDWERDAKTGFTLELEVGRLVTNRLSLWARPGVGVWNNELPQIYDWNFEVGFRYFLD
jgi:hypothetical protein